MGQSNVAAKTEVTGASTKSFPDAIQAAFSRADETVRGITGMRILDQRISAAEDKILEYRVTVEVIFILES